MKSLNLIHLLLFKLFILSSMLLIFCNKKIDTQELIIGNWKIDSIQLRSVIDNREVFQTISRPTDDYYDYRNDNKLYRRWMNHLDTVQYSITEINKKSLIQYRYGADTIVSLNKKQLIINNPQGNYSRIFFTKN